MRYRNVQNYASVILRKCQNYLNSIIYTNSWFFTIFDILNNYYYCRLLNSNKVIKFKLVNY